MDLLLRGVWWISLDEEKGTGLKYQWDDNGNLGLYPLFSEETRRLIQRVRRNPIEYYCRYIATFPSPRSRSVWIESISFLRDRVRKQKILKNPSFLFEPYAPERTLPRFHSYPSSSRQMFNESFAIGWPSEMVRLIWTYCFEPDNKKRDAAFSSVLPVSQDHRIQLIWHSDHQMYVTTISS